MMLGILDKTIKDASLNGNILPNQSISQILCSINLFIRNHFELVRQTQLNPRIADLILCIAPKLREEDKEELLKVF